MINIEEKISVRSVLRMAGAVLAIPEYTYMPLALTTLPLPLLLGHIHSIDNTSVFLF
jgi:hypothetical protein